MTWSQGRGKKEAPSPRVEKRGRAEVMWALERPGGEAEVYLPAMDMYEKEETLVIELELPGVKKEAIEVYVTRNTVMVEGIKTDVMPGGSAREGISYLRLERKLGHFFREIELPIPCNTRTGEARYERGLLILEFKKIKDRRGERHKIEVK